MSKMLQGQVDLEAHLQEQIGFLERSAESFDAGHSDEAKRIAVTLRVLLHDTSNSHSLLQQLGRKGVKFCDSTFKLDPANLVAHAGLVGISVGPADIKHVASLDGDNPSWFRWVEFNEWWNTTIFTIQGGQLTRKDLILAVANQDGGAHVEPALNEDYARLSRHNALGRFAGAGPSAVPLREAERVAVRQIAHEVLKTVKPGYSKQPISEGAAIIGSVEVRFEPLATSKPEQ